LEAFSHNKAIIRQTAKALQQTFDLKLPVSLDHREQLVALLVPTLRQWLDHDLERLLQFCYRIDLNEERLKGILHESAPEKIAEDLSRAIVARQLQKFELRKKYGN
jgi:hypothetical protein